MIGLGESCALIFPWQPNQKREKGECVFRGIWNVETIEGSLQLSRRRKVGPAILT
jgi:hypothetical protein